MMKPDDIYCFLSQLQDAAEGARLRAYAATRCNDPASEHYLMGKAEAYEQVIETVVSYFVPEGCLAILNGETSSGR